MAAESIGSPANRIIWRHLFPNALTPIIVAITFGIPTAIFTEAALSFIGVGISPPTPSWGQNGRRIAEISSAILAHGNLPAIGDWSNYVIVFVPWRRLRDALDPRR